MTSAATRSKKVAIPAISPARRPKCQAASTAIPMVAINMGCLEHTSGLPRALSRDNATCVTPLLFIWYGAGLYVLALVVSDTRRRAKSEGIDWRRFALTTALPMILGSALFTIWPLVAWALTRAE